MSLLLEQAFIWYSSILAAVFASLAVFFAQYNAVQSASQKFNEHLIPMNECLHFILKQNLSEPLLTFRNSASQPTMESFKFQKEEKNKRKIAKKKLNPTSETTKSRISLSTESLRIVTISQMKEETFEEPEIVNAKEEEEELKSDEVTSTEISEYLLVQPQLTEDQLFEIPCLPKINEESLKEPETVDKQEAFEIIDDTGNLFYKDNEIKEDKNFETPVFIDNDEDEDIFFNDRMRLEYMHRMRLGNFYHRAYCKCLSSNHCNSKQYSVHQPAFPNYSRGPMFSHPIGFALNFEVNSFFNLKLNIHSRVIIKILCR